MKIAVKRMEGLQLGRLIAALAIVWIHAPNEPTQLTMWARWAVPFFAAVSACLATCARPPSFVSWTLSRFRRLYVPFLLWNLTYWAVRLIPRMLIDKPTWHFTARALLLDGFIHHLWFLPFIMIAGMVAQALARMDMPKKLLTALVVVLSIAMSLVERKLIVAPECGYFAGLAWDNSPAVLAGVAIGLKSGSLAHLQQACLKYRWMGWLSFALGVGIPMIMCQRISALENLAGVGAMVAFVGMDDDHVWDLAKRIAPYTFGIYVLHVFFVEGLQDLLPKTGLSLSPHLSMVVSFCFGVSGSIVGARFLRRYNFGRSLIP